MHLYVGTYTRASSYHTAGKSQGLYVYQVDVTTGTATLQSVVKGIDDPSFVAVDSKQRTLYAVSEVGGWEECTVSAYSIDPQTGDLRYLNKQVTLGSSAAHIAIDRNDRYVFTANYSGGKAVAMFPVREDGGLAPACWSVEHEGSGPVAARQERSHPHCTVIDPTNRYVYVNDLGIDKIMMYQLDTEKGRLEAISKAGFHLEPGSGPRHLTFHPNGRFAYITLELNSMVSVLAVEPATGRLTLLQTLPMLPDDFHAWNTAADIHVSPDGRFLYASNRGHDSIAIYRIDPESGTLTLVGRQATLGKIPRNFAIDPSGKLLLVANQDTDTVVSFHIDAESGMLTPTGQVIEVPTPVCVQLVAV